MIKIYRKKIVWSEKETQLFSDKIEQRRQNNLLRTENKKAMLQYGMVFCNLAPKIFMTDTNCQKISYQ